MTYISVELNDYDETLFYAAYRNDYKTIVALSSSLGVNFNVRDREGRTALQVAASEGNLESVQALVEIGAGLASTDIRGNDALGDARREKRQAVISYITTVISDTVIKHYCTQFGEGLLKKGVQQALGSFNKKFSDLYIKVSQPLASYKERLSFLT